MTVTMDHKNSRKSSWDSKMSVSTVSTTTRQFRRSPSSIISSDSDIRFTRKKLSSNYRCGCCIIALFLLFLLLAAGALYVAYTFFAPEPFEDQTFRAMFRVVDGDTFTPDLADPATSGFRNHAKDYEERLNLLFKQSGLRRKFLDTEILALDGNEGNDLVVHFNVRLDPASAVEPEELQTILSSEITAQSSPYFLNLTIDPSSLDVQKNYAGTTTTTLLPSTKPVTPASTNRPPPPRQCVPVRLKYCQRLPYNFTSYPNILGHNSLKDVEDDVIAFRGLVDGECYRQAYEFVCQVLQPACLKGRHEDVNILPCRSFCRDFMTGCGSRLPAKLKEHLDCNRFPEFSGTQMCRPKPDCALEMQQRGLASRICDGVVDCQDLSDEKSCNYCPNGYIHCGIGRACIPTHYRCDGKIDCPDGGDERACLSIAPTLANVTKLKFVTPHLAQYHAEGYVVFNEKGQVGKLCTENVNIPLFPNKTDVVLQTVASSLCSTLSYQKMTSVQIKLDTEPNVQYVKMKDPTATEITFVRTPCSSKQVLHVGCSDIECGFQSVHGSGGIQILNKMAGHGDWPWHAALFKEDVHVCDGTLVSSDWLVTTASCFQGQPKAEWTARLGTVRLAGTSPWQQERRIVGLVKSPVEGSTIAMVKLEEAVHMSDFVRPICLPKEKSSILSSNMSYCNTLGWARNREQLQRVQLKVSEMEKCANISITTVNSLCTEAAYSKDDCNEEELAGSPMLCLLPDGVRWSLVGVSNWRIACSKVGVERPRMYDKITSNVDWIHQTISAIA